ncbi:MAG: hypothetical protein AAF288_13905 [Planctomycetota bacterium]
MHSITPGWLHERLDWPSAERGLVDAVLDTDTFNEIDDQFALAYTLLSPERLRLHARYAAPFHNDRSTGPSHGMAQNRVLDRMAALGGGLAHRGAEA